MRKTLMHTDVKSVMKNYLGAKSGSGVAARIIAEMPPHNVYIEPFAGSAIIARTKRPAYVNMLYDIDCDVIRSLRADGDDALSHFEISCLPWLDVADALKETLQSPFTLLYLDPPYPACVRARDRYENEMRNDDAHRGLCLSLLSLNCMVMISSYPNDIYDGILAGWRTVDIPTMTQRGPRVERLWCNFPEPVYLHDSRFVGKNSRQRWRIGKRARRWREKYLALPPAERQAMMAELWDADLNVVQLRNSEL